MFLLLSTISNSVTFLSQIVALLLQNGANPLLKNKSGKVPHEIVDNETIKEMLLNAISGSAAKAEGDPLAVYNPSEKVILNVKLN